MRSQPNLRVFQPGGPSPRRERRASHLCDGSPERLQSQPCGWLSSLCSYDGEQIGFEERIRRTLRSLAGQISQLGASAQPRETTAPAAAASAQHFGPGALPDDSRFSDTAETPPRPSGACPTPRARHPCSSIVVGTEGSLIHSNGSSSSGVCS